MPLTGTTDDSLASFLEAKVRAGSFPGACWHVEAGGRPASSGAVGWACIEPERIPTTRDTPYDLASLTKPLATAWLAVQIEQRGLVNLDAPARLALPELIGTPYARATFLDLGAHRAGLPPWKPLYLEAEDLDGYVRAIASTPPAAAFGTTVYSDLGYVLLGAAVERIAGDTLERLFRRSIAAPLSLPRAGFACHPSRFGDAAATERGNVYERTLVGAVGATFPWRAEVIRAEPHDGNAHCLGGVAGHAGLFATAGEVAAMAREILAGPALPWSPSSRARLLRPVAGSGTRTFGFVPAAGSSAARGVLPDAAPGHTGFTGTSLWLDVEGGGSSSF